MNNQGQENQPSVADSKAALEIEKLKAEIENLRKSNSLGARLAQYNPVVTVLIAVVGVIFSIHQFNTQQKQNTEQHLRQQEANSQQMKLQSDRDFTAREQESKKRYWEEQNQIYKEACDAAATIAAASSLEEVKAERKKFRRLYWGIMSLVENSSVERAMVAFDRSLSEWENNHSKPWDLVNHAYTIAHCCRKSLQATWSPVEIGDLKDKQCPY
jgi:hypothetical protein